MKARTRSDAQPAGDLVRYLRREGEFAPQREGGDESRDRDVDYLMRVRPDTLDHDDVVGAPLVGNLPAWAEHDAGRFFVAASREERVNGQYAIAFQIALPRELTHEQHMALAQDFVDAVMHDKPYLVVKHEPVREGQGQPHLHILMSPRRIDGIERTETQFFRRWNPGHPERGGAQKDRFWNQRQAPYRVREAFSDLANRHLEMAGAQARIDPRSLRKRGIERERISWNNKVELDPATRAREQVQAATAWEQRKAYKGLDESHTMSREDMVLLVRQWTREYGQGTALPTSSPESIRAYQEKEIARLTQEAQQLEHEMHGLDAYLEQVQAEQKIERFFAAHGRERSPAGQRQAERVLAAGQAHGLPYEPQSLPWSPSRAAQTVAQRLAALARQLAHDDEAVGGTGLRVKLFDREYEPGRGRSW